MAVATRLDAAGVPWLVAGGSARALLGHGVRPRDLDVEVDGRAADRAAAALGIVLAADRGGHVESRRARSRVGPVELDVSADLVVAGPGGRLGADFALWRRWSAAVAVGALVVRCLPVEEQLARAVAEGDGARAGRLRSDAAVAGVPVRERYLARRLASASASAAR